VDGPFPTATVTPSQWLRNEATDVHFTDTPSSSAAGERTPLIRRASASSSDSETLSPTTVNKYGRSTFGQTVFSPLKAGLSCTNELFFQLFNCVAMLVGIGLLSVPLAFAYAGWLAGTVIILSYGFLSCYTYVVFESSTVLV
jgi:vesicular inhibitory amino acid transporter